MEKVVRDELVPKILDDDDLSLCRATPAKVSALSGFKVALNLSHKAGDRGRGEFVSSNGRFNPSPISRTGQWRPKNVSTELLDSLVGSARKPPE